MFLANSLKGLTEKGANEMFKRQYPIMMGLGTKILTAYHHPNFKNGLMFAILDSKKKFPRGHNVSNDELKQSMSTVRAEIYFSEIDTLDGFIKHLEYERDLWAKEIEKNGEKMTYSDMLKEAQSLSSETIVDYRPACGLYVDGMDDCEQIPNAIVCWTKNGSKFIYIKKGEDNENM